MAENQQNIDWAVSDYEFQLAVHQQEFADFVKDQSSKILECDQECVNDCVNAEFIQFSEIPQCLKYCYCAPGALTIEDGELNYPELIEYSEHDTQAWSFFKMLQARIWEL